tara:strand:+ start:692 stop:997 length:306 start_codon:yes stop_codon:yes gene_type:complete
MTDLRQAAQQALHELEGIPIYRKYGVRISNAITALRTALEQQAEPVVDCPRCGHVCSQRQWVGLTNEDVNRESAPIAQQMKLAFHAGMYVAQQILKEKNSD